MKRILILAIAALLLLSGCGARESAEPVPTPRPIVTPTPAPTPEPRMLAIEAYGKLLDTLVKKLGEDVKIYTYYYGYRLYDLDRDGTPELLVKTGTGDDDTRYRLFAWTEDYGAVLVGSFGGGYGYLCPWPEGLLYYREENGMRSLNQIFYAEGTLREERITPVGLRGYGVNRMGMYDLDDPGGLNWEENPASNPAALTADLLLEEPVPVAEATLDLSRSTLWKLALLGDYRDKGRFMFYDFGAGELLCSMSYEGMYLVTEIFAQENGEPVSLMRRVQVMTGAYAVTLKLVDYEGETFLAYGVSEDTDGKGSAQDAEVWELMETENFTLRHTLEGTYYAGRLRTALLDGEDMKGRNLYLFSKGTILLDSASYYKEPGEGDDRGVDVWTLLR